MATARGWIDPRHIDSGARYFRQGAQIYGLIPSMTGDLQDIPEDLEVLKAALITERGRRIVAEADAASAKAKVSSAEALMGHLKLQIKELRRAF